MTMKAILTDDAPLPVGPYSQAIISNDTVIVSGQIPLDPKTGIIPDCISEQATLVFSNLMSILNAAGVMKGRIMQVTVYLTNMDDFNVVNDIYKRFFSEPFPARTCIGVSALPKGSKIMADALGGL